MKYIFVLICMMVFLVAPVMSESVITTSGTSERMVSPTYATISFEVSTENYKVVIAQSQNREISGKVIDMLLKSGISKEDIKTIGYNIYPVYDSGTYGYSGKVRSYRVSNTFQVCVRDLDRTGEIIDLVVSGGVNGVSSISFGIDDDNVRNIKRDMLKEAVLNSKSDAEVIASALDMEIIGVKDVSLSYTNIPRYSDAQYILKESVSSTPIESGLMKISTGVSITYLLN
ncbi:MAG: oxidative stress defense protein [Candidatus Methanofastidiosum methylothiophilum]|uniref:Oxidative stress defense protein n=1 Tax=Candidatus Methanofastidiosum methylothiophilum TaxID=1705564 RepID=A0A150IVF1_9EURY|nr:MAG: oxidative stress defense protein [Candidatus Methanofastidiosum methylthiophilus]